MPPPNDDRAGAEEVPFGAGSGTVSGTTIDATEEAGGPFDGYDVQDVWYVWPSLPAGTFTFTITPTTPGFAGSYEAWFNNVEPTDWTVDDSIASGSDVGVPFNVNFEHPGGTLTLAVFTYTGDPGGEETDFDFEWTWTAPVAPPGNDDRVDAVLVPVGDYWGIVRGGTTQGSTQDAGAGWTDGTIRDVWYYWDDLPAGIVYLYVRPTDPFGQAGSDTRFDAYLKSVAPTSWTSDADSTRLTGGQGDIAQGQHTHTGGSLTLAVVTFTGHTSGAAIDFDFGWGHSLDETPSHWGAVTDDEWVKREATVATEDEGSFNLIRSDNVGRQGRAASLVNVTPSTTPPAPSLYDCLFENASYGVTGITMVGGEGCEYQGPSGGEASGTDSVGAFYQATGSVSVTGGVPTATTTENMTVAQTVRGFRFAPPAPLAFRGPLTEDDAIRALAPSNFDDYDAAASPQLVWGFEFVAADPEWETRNVTLGDYRAPYSTPPDGLDELGSNTVTMQTLPQSVVVAAPAGSTSPNRVSLDYDTVFGADIDASYITPGVGTDLETLSETLTEVVFPSFTDVDPLFVTSDVDDEWLIVLNISAEVLVASPPPVESVADGEDWISSSMRDVLGGDIVPGWDARTPPWRAYLGFPLVLGGWYVGKIGAGGPA